jgi:uncharacterized pyridoxamine 5'-phosphate oxidase family protein
MFSFEKDGKLWFNTGNFKDVYKKLQNNLYIWISVRVLYPYIGR